MTCTWWFIPLSKWVITLVINGINGVSPLITTVITHLLSGMNHQVLNVLTCVFFPVLWKVVVPWFLQNRHAAYPGMRHTHEIIGYVHVGVSINGGIPKSLFIVENPI